MHKRFLLSLLFVNGICFQINGFFDFKLSQEAISRQENFQKQMLDLQKENGELIRNANGYLKSHFNYIKELDGGLLPRFLIGVLINAGAQYCGQSDSNSGVRAQVISNFILFDLSLLFKIGSLKEVPSSVLTHHIFKVVATGYAAWDVGVRLGKLAKKYYKRDASSFEV